MNKKKNPYKQLSDYIVALCKQAKRNVEHSPSRYSMTYDKSTDGLSKRINEGYEEIENWN